jgi:hypothetical protein
MNSESEKVLLVPAIAKWSAPPVQLANAVAAFRK